MADQAGFVSFIRNVAGISTTALPDASPVIDDAYEFSIEVVNLYLAAIGPKIYDLAVYNLGTDYVLNWAPDSPPSTFFTDYRKTKNLVSFTAGVVASSSDEGTANSLLVPDAFKGLMISDLQLLGTPFGRAYLAIAQKFGSLWGIS